MTFANELMARIYYLWMLLVYTGILEKSTWHLEILSQYNKIDPLPRGYKPNKNDAWCAIFLCAIGWSAGFRLWPWECSVPRIQTEARRRGIWRKGWSTMPKLGDWVVFDWGNNGTADHIGAVCAIFGNSVWIVEGNNSDSVKIRRLTVGDGRVEGTVALDFSELVEAPTESTEALRPGDSGSRVFLLQTLLKGAGYFYGLPSGEYDEKTTAAVMDFQLYNGLEVDGKAGPKTQAKIRGGNFAVRTATDEEVDTVGINRYKRIEDVPEYARPTVAKLVDRGLLLGVDVDDLGLSDDLLRMLVINDRAGLYDMTE